MVKITTGELARMVQGKLEGNPDIILYRPSKIEEATEGSICFFANPKYESYVYTTAASAILVSDDFVPKQPIAATLIRVKDVYQTVAQLLAAFEDKSKPMGYIDPLAKVDASVKVGENVHIGAFSYIGSGANIGSNVIIHPQVYIGDKVQIGENSILYPGVRIYKDCIIGKHCIINYNAVIGNEGFGFAPDDKGEYHKIAQIGNVVLEDNVEIGANSCIDRGSMGSTRIGKGSKLDNLIQIAHNVQIGEHTVIAAQAGIAGSTKVGNFCQIGGQVGIVGHIQIPDGTKIQAQSGVAGNIKEPNTKLYGSPAIDYSNYLKSYAEFRNLPETVKKIRYLEKIIRELQK